MSTQPVFTKEAVKLSKCDLREILVGEHHVLRRQLEELRENVGRLLAGKENAIAALLRTLEELQLLLSVHLDHEEDLLEPLLEKIDAWGPIRLERLHQEHAHQREWLSNLRNMLLSAVSVEELARRSYALLEALAADMAHEEKDLFSVLNDELIQLDAGDN